MAYVPLEVFRITDADRSSRRIRDMPYGKVALKGNLSPLDINFGLVPLLTMSAGQNIMLVNQGYDKLVINSITTVGDYLINSQVPTVLDAGEVSVITTVFTPRREGIITGGISIDLGNAEGKHFAVLRGTGAAVTEPGEGDGPVVILDLKLNVLTELLKRDYPLGSMVPAGQPERIMVFVGGAIQKPAIDYTVIVDGANNILRFTTALDVAGLEILAIGTKIVG